jgi:sugar/nucleoside kinase (ribokinase family)
MIDIVCIGYAAYDLFYYLDDFPEENKKYMTTRFMESGGGPAANAAFLLSTWGVHTAFAGLVGDDTEGKKILKQFEEIGTDTSLVEIRQGYKTPLSAIIVNKKTGTRTIITRSIPEEEYELGADRLEALKPKIVLADGWRYKATLQALAALPASVFILDAGSLRTATSDLLKKVHYAVCAEPFAKAFSGEASLKNRDALTKSLSKLYAANRRNVAITLGERGVAFWDNDRVEVLKAPHVKAIDTTAAGDIFHGAFALAILEDKTFRDTLAFAMATATLSVTRPGGRSSIPARSEVEEFLKQV